jgi:alpha/beta superfamily hydrolase
VEIITPDGATTCIVLAHPHPDYGGSMYDSVVDAIFRSMTDVGRVRFDFRSSDIELARADVLGAIDAVPAELDVVLCGYSFGADVSLSVDSPRVTAWIAIAPPLGLVPVAEMAAPTDARPKHLLVAEHDQFNPPSKVTPTIEGWTSTTMEVIAGADHFLGGALDRVVAGVRDAMSRTG